MSISIFISWSGPEARHAATVLRNWLPLVLQQTQPWMSDEDIRAGQRWNQEISAQLEKVNLAILCITPESSKSPWLLFEAGALAKSMEHSRVIPWVLDGDKALLGPLGQFQAKAATEEDTWVIVKDLASKGGSTLDMGRLRELYDRMWPSLEHDLAQRPRAETSSGDSLSESADEGPDGSAVLGYYLNEILLGVRDIQRRIGYVGPSTGNSTEDMGIQIAGQLMSNVLHGMIERAAVDPEGAMASVDGLARITERLKQVSAKSGKNQTPEGEPNADG